MSGTGRLIVAVDGPSGSGKSSVCRAVATRLRLSYLDTGAMYRAACLACLGRGLDLTDRDAVTALTLTTRIEVSLDPAVSLVRLDGRDVTAEIRESPVSLAVSDVAAIPAVRHDLAARQRDLIRRDPRGCVAEGRDITTVVAPDADVRILLTARAEARVARRARQLHGSDAPALRGRTAAEVLDRDDRDSAVTTFLVAAPGVTVLDTTTMGLDETVAAVLRLALGVSGAGR